MSQTFKQQVMPHHSLFSYDMATGETELVWTIYLLTEDEVKYYKVTKEAGKVYLQAVTKQSAINKFNQFIKHYESKVKSSEVVQG